MAVPCTFSKVENFQGVQHTCTFYTVVMLVHGRWDRDCTILCPYHNYKQIVQAAKPLDRGSGPYSLNCESLLRPKPCSEYESTTYRKLRDSMVISSMDTAMSSETVAKLHTSSSSKIKNA